MNEKQKISKETIDYVSKLAHLDLNEEEKGRLSGELSDILDYFEKLNDLNTNDIEPTTHAIEGLINVFREDKPQKSLSNEEALKNAKHKKDGYFKAPRILKE